MERVGCSYSKPDERRMNITVLEKLKTIKKSSIQVRHNKIDVIDSGIWANRMVEYWDDLTYVQQWRVYERLIVVVRILEGRETPTEEWFYQNKKKYYNSMSVDKSEVKTDVRDTDVMDTDVRGTDVKETDSTARGINTTARKQNTIAREYNTNQTKLF